MSAVFAQLEDRGILEIAGADRKAFLQGLVSNDVQKLGPHRALYAAFLTPQGKYLHDFFLVEQGEVILLEGERARLPDLLRRLSIFKLRSKATLADVSDRFSIAVAFGEAAGAKLGLPADLGAYVSSFGRGRMARALSRPRGSLGRSLRTTTGYASRWASQTAAAISSWKKRSCSKRDSTSSTASTGTRAATWARS